MSEEDETREQVEVGAEEDLAEEDLKLKDEDADKVGGGTKGTHIPEIVIE